MEITIKIDGHMVSVEVSTDVGEFLEQSKQNYYRGTFALLGQPRGTDLPMGNLGRNYGGISPVY